LQDGFFFESKMTGPESLCFASRVLEAVIKTTFPESLCFASLVLWSSHFFETAVVKKY